MFVFLEQEVDSKKGKSRDSCGFLLEGKRKEFDPERGICFP